MVFSLKRLLKNGRIRTLLFSALGSLCVVLLLGLPRIPAIAQISQATIQEIIGGDRVFIEAEQAQVGDVAQFQEEVRTEQSKTALRFNNGAAGRLGQNSSVRIGQCVEVRQGALLASGPANGCVSGFDVGVQGTMYVLETDDRDPDILANLKVLEGETLLGQRQSPSGRRTPLRLRQGQKVALLANGEIGPVRRIAAEEFADILKGELFRGFRQPLPNQAKLQGVCQSLFPNRSCSVTGIPLNRNAPVRGLY